MILVSFCSGSVDWIYPSAQMTGMTFNYIDTVYFTWTSDIDGPWMNLWCAPSPSANQSKTYGKSHFQIADPVHLTKEKGEII